ncbi:MAG: aminotransferase class I/II-fold pyridoxal phosphate-dependent enzyme [Candidatus Marsarchaeota archaeon]|jgi:alanine-synthesizing transaminase|nr:aminotransferase class I/II-fold pyridoxal phosphate-dependent enzyme [Candidatus Marsarchaeota archaeon]
MGFLSERSRYAQNAIEMEDSTAEALVEKGMKIIHLNRGDPTYYIKTPKYEIDAYKKALDDNKVYYSRAQGIIELTNAIVKRYKVLYNLKFNEDKVIVTQGVSEALSMLNSALINKNDKAVLFSPYYPLYITQLKLNGGYAILERYDESNKWNIHIDDLKKSLKFIKNDGKINKVKYMLITNPNNPTGTVMDRSVLEEIVDIANEYNIMLVSDEIYDEIIFNNAKFTSISKIAKGIPHIILNGVSKNYNATGFRIGYVIIPEDDKKSLALRSKFYSYSMVRLSSNTPAEYSAAEAIGNISAHKREIQKFVKLISDRVNFTYKILTENKYINIVRPNSAYYLFPKIYLKELGFKNDTMFVDKLLKEEGIQIVWGSAFGAPSHVRIVALAPKPILKYAVTKFNNFCKKYAK